MDRRAGGGGWTWGDLQGMDPRALLRCRGEGEGKLKVTVGGTGLRGVSWGSSGHRGYHRLLSGLPGSHPWTMAPPPGSTPSRTGGFLGTTSPGPMAELYGAANQDSGVSSYISAASPAPSTGFGHSLGVSG